MSDLNEVKNEELDELVDIITLTDEDGQDQQFEFADYLEYEGKEYVALLPVEDDGTVLFLEVVEVDEETEEYITIEKDEILDALFEIFKERHADEFNFED